MTIELPRTTCSIMQAAVNPDAAMSAVHRQGLFQSQRHFVETELAMSTHHHANLCVCLVIYSLVQHNVHELVKASQGACDLPVAIQGHRQPA